MHGMSFHIYKTPNHKTWTLAYTASRHRHTAVYPTRSDAMQASYHRAMVAMEN